MAASHLWPETPEERLIWWAITGTWVLYVLGAIYHVIPLIGWGLAVLGCGRRLGYFGGHDQRTAPLRLGPWLWIAGMLVMAFALVAGHMSFDAGVGDTIKSLFGWIKGWALFAVLIFAGASLKVRPAIIFRASNILAGQMLIVTPFFLAAGLLHLPNIWYVSPMLSLGGPGPYFFQVVTHLHDSSALGFRLTYFSPWAPAAAFVAQMMFVFALYDRSRFWQVTGIASALIACYFTQSRLSLVAIPALALALPMLSNLGRPMVAAIVSMAAVLGGALFRQITASIADFTEAFNNARAESSRVRATLQRMALHRWENEAWWFGHGKVERGPHLVEYMPIGSHHTWAGLLFVKGAVGCAALAVPFAWTLVETLLKAQRDRAARAALGFMIVLFLNSFGENLEILAYLAWPGLLLVGIVLQRRVRNPLGAVAFGWGPASEANAALQPV